MNGTKYTRMNQVNFFIGFLLQISLGSFLNIVPDKLTERKDSVYTCFSLQKFSFHLLLTRGTEDESNSKNMTFSATSYHFVLLRITVLF